MSKSAAARSLAVIVTGQTRKGETVDAEVRSDGLRATLLLRESQGVRDFLAK